MKIVLMTMPTVWEQDQHDFMNRRRGLFRWLRIKPLVNVVPSPSLLYLAPWLLEDGHEVHYLEGLFYSLEEVIGRLGEISPDIIGITLTSVDWENSRWMITELKKTFPGCLVAAGGIHPTLWLERCFEECPGLDLIVYGEGEETMRELASALTEEKPLDTVKGLIFRRGEELVKTPERPVTEDTDSLPFPSHDLVDTAAYLPSPTFYKRLPHANIIGARGCPYRCIFCHTDPSVRMRTSARSKARLEWIK